MLGVLLELWSSGFRKVTIMELYMMTLLHVIRRCFYILLSLYRMMSSIMMRVLTFLSMQAQAAKEAAADEVPLDRPG